jgi:hypothetical protein
MFPIPKCVFLTHGVGIHRHLLTAFEYALRNADIEQQNIVTVSSILPPGCELITRVSGVATLESGRTHLLRPGAVGDQRTRPPHRRRDRSRPTQGYHPLRLYLGAPRLRHVGGCDSK